MKDVKVSDELYGWLESLAQRNGSSVEMELDRKLKYYLYVSNTRRRLNLPRKPNKGKFNPDKSIEEQKLPETQE